MQTVRVTTVVSFVVFSILTTFQVEAVEKDPALGGKWLLLQIDRGGKDIDLDHLEGSVREMGEETYSLKPLEGETITGKYSVDARAKPKTLDMVVDNGRFKGKTLKGIYRVKGGRLTISFGAPGKERPRSFVSQPGTEYTVATHKKIKPAKAAGVDPTLPGKWLLLRINRGGADIDLDHLEGAVREMGEETYSLKPLEGETITGKYSVDSRAEPKTLDMVVDNGRFKGKTLKGIYRVKGGRLTISFGAPGKERPRFFVSKPGTEYTVAIHKRMK
jgi:uncharacterized protein (TIGR03067 family)